MFKCNNCDKEFEEPEEVHTTYESYYGVSGMFPNSNPLTYEVCPYCNSEDFIEIEDEE